MGDSLTEPKERLREAFKDLEDEHASILEMLSQARQTTERAKLLPMLTEAHSMLTRHFAKETYPGGFYESMGACTAEYQDELRVLVTEHSRMYARLWSLIESIRISDESKQDFSEEVSAVSAMLKAHERKEHDLAERLLS